MERTQFTFYDSFYRALSRIRSKTARCDAYDILCRYALSGEEPDLDAYASAVGVAFEMMKPNLEASRRKSEGAVREQISRKKEKGISGCNQDHDRMLSGYDQDTGRIPPGPCQDEDSKNKDKNKNKIKNKDKCPEAFASFWEAYPRKEGRMKALEAFGDVQEPLKTLLDALEQQKTSDQWTKDGGRYIPSAATWLREHRWEDRLRPSGQIPKGASGTLGEAELEAIRRVMAQDPM